MVALFASFAQAEDQASALQEQTVTVASRSEQALRELTTSVSLLTEAELQKLGYLSVSEALATLPSTTVSNNGGRGKATSVSIRGEAGFRTLILLDGIDLADPSAPQAVASTEHILSSGLSRIEVLRGPHGLAYGADAGGVINIKTRRPEEEGLSAGIEAQTGSYATQLLAGDLAYNHEKIGFYIQANQFETDGFNTLVVDDTRDDDGYDNTTIHSRVSVQILEQLSAEATYRHVEGESEYDGCYTTTTFAFIHNCLSDYEQDSQRLALNYNGFGTHELSYSRNEIERNNFSEGEFSFGAKGSIDTLAYKGRANLGKHSVIFGFDDKTEDIDSISGEDQYERGQQGVYVELLGEFTHDIFVNAGLRRDDNDDFGSHNSYRLGAAKLISLNQDDELKFKASYGTGFRAPSVYEEYLNNAFGPVDMPALEEEQSSGFDLGVEYFGSEGLHLEAIYFSQTVENEIYYDLLSYTGYLQGDGDSKASGFELIADVPLSTTWSYRLNYSYTDTEQSDGSVRSRIPKHSAALSVLANLLNERLQLALHLRANADIYDVASLGEQENYSVLDASISYAFNDNLDFYLRMENIADEAYQSVPGYYAAEASAYGGLKYRF